MTIRGFAGLPDGSEWIVDEVPLAGDELAPAGDEVTLVGDEDAGDGSAAFEGLALGVDAEAAGRALARRMIAAGARDLLGAAEEMATGPSRGGGAR